MRKLITDGLTPIARLDPDADRRPWPGPIEVTVGVEFDVQQNYVISWSASQLEHEAWCERA